MCIFNERLVSSLHPEGIKHNLCSLNGNFAPFTPQWKTYDHLFLSYVIVDLYMSRDGNCELCHLTSQNIRLNYFTSINIFSKYWGVKSQPMATYMYVYIHIILDKYENIIKNTHLKDEIEI